MQSYFSKEFFEGNRRRLKTLFIGKAPIVLTANGLLQRSGDTTFPFRQDSNFWYLTGINEPDFILVIDKDKEYLIASERSPTMNIFGGHQNLEKLRKTSGIKDIVDSNDGWKRLSARLLRSKHIATLAATQKYITTHGFYVNPAKTALLERVKECNALIKPLDLRRHLSTMRTIKQPEELLAIQAAIDVSAKAFAFVKSNLKKYEGEHQIEAELSKKLRLGSSGHAFSPIVASGRNSGIIHYQTNDDLLKNKKTLLIDAGAEVENYAADISRTYFLKNPTKRTKAVYEAVKNTQDYGANLLKQGVNIKNYEKQVEHFLGEKLRELGLIKNITSEQVRKYCPHSITHFLGLDTHDAGNYEQPLQANTVLTIEPGIYIPKEDVGVRIEDDYHVTSSGVKNLSVKAPYA